MEETELKQMVEAWKQQLQQIETEIAHAWIEELPVGRKRNLLGDADDKLCATRYKLSELQGLIEGEEGEGESPSSQ